MALVLDCTCEPPGKPLGSKHKKGGFFLTAFNQKVLQNYPLRMFIWMQKSIEFHLPHYEISELSSC